MKICVDIELSLQNLRGWTSNITKNYKLIKFAVKLHKSIKKYENADFSMNLNKFPINNNKFEVDNIKFIGERRIQTLINENIIRNISPFSSIDDHVEYYSDLKRKIK